MLPAFVAAPLSAEVGNSTNGGRDMAFGSAAAPAPGSVSGQHSRIVRLAEWTRFGIPVPEDAHALVTGLYERHQPRPQTLVLGVLGPGERLVASASFNQETARPDGWEYRNALLSRLRRIVPHDLRRRTPTRTAVLLCCRFGEPGWTAVDGAWMWGLRDACTLHGLRCGTYITLTASGWQVMGAEPSGSQPAAARSAEPRNEPVMASAHSAEPTSPGPAPRITA